jgi:hypothetical protein
MQPLIRPLAGLLFLFALAGIRASAQTDFSGVWSPVPDEDTDGQPYLGEFQGIPLSRGGLLRAESWSASWLTLPEWQCRPAGAMFYRGPQDLHIYREIDPASRETVAWHAEWLRTGDNVYFMDGRPHPSAYAPHTWAGFSTAEWVGDMLKITTTHLKEQYYRRNGVDSGDRATLITYLLRRGDVLTWITIANDPDNLTEPMIRTMEYRLTLGRTLPPSPCTVVEEIDRPAGVVPHYLPGQNPFLGEFGEKYGLPLEVTKGGAATMYPEAARKLLRSVNPLTATIR